MKRKTLIALIISSCVVVVGCVGLVFWALAATQVNVKTNLTVTYKPEKHVVCDVSARYQKTTDSEPIPFNSGTLNLEYGSAETTKNMSASETDIELNDTNTYVIFEFKFENKNLMPNYVLNISLTDNANISNVKRKYFFGDMMFFSGGDIYGAAEMARDYLNDGGIEHDELETTSLSIGYQGIGKIYMLLEITPGIAADYTASQLNQFMFTLTTTEENNAEPVSYLSSDWASRNYSTIDGDMPVFYLVGGAKTIDFTDDESKIEGLTYIASVGTTRETTHSPYPSEAVEGIADVSLYIDEQSPRVVFYSPAKIYAPVNSFWLFFVYSGMGNSFDDVTTFNLDNFDTSKVKYAGFFNGFKSLTSVDVSHFDTTNMVSMASMFSGCSSLTNLDVSNFDTSNVTNMRSMFESCSSLTSLDLGNFNLASCTNVDYMLSGCSALTSITLPYNLKSGKTIDLPASTYYNGSAGPYSTIGTATSGTTVACSTADTKVTLTKR